MNGERSENSEDEAVPIGGKEREYSLVPVKKRSDGLVADPALVVVLENVMRRLRAPQQPVKPALPSGHVEYQPPAPREVMEALKNGTPWIGVGMDARLRTAGLPRDAETVIAQLDRTWMNNEKPLIIIADSTLVHNIYARLWRKEKNWQDPHKDNPDKRDPKWRSDKQLMVVATKEAKIAGAQKKAYLEALHQIQSDSSSNAVYLMSEVLEGHEEFDVLFEKIRELVKNDPGLREKMWRCVPGVIREKVAKHVTSDTTFEEATAKSDSLLQTFKKAENLLAYAEHEIAMIFFGRTKIGVEAPEDDQQSESFKWSEAVYDEMAQYLLENYADQLGLDPEMKLVFRYLKIPGLISPIFYSSQPVSEDTLEEPYRVRSFIVGKDAWEHAKEALVDVEYTRGIYKIFFEKIDDSPYLTKKEKKEVKKDEIIKLFREIVIQFTTIPHINDCLSGIKFLETVENLMRGDSISADLYALHISPNTQDGESEAGYLVRYFQRFLLSSMDDLPGVLNSDDAMRLCNFLVSTINWLYTELEQKESTY